MKRMVMAFGVACLLCGFANAQDQEKAAREKMQAEQAQLSIRRDVPEMQDAGVMFGEVVKGAPFTAQRTEESTQTLGDGTHINNKSSISYARDSAGRVRREDDEWITIYDPVANATYRLNKKNHTGSKVEFIRGEARIRLDKLNQEIAINQETADELKAQSEKALAEDKARQGNSVAITNQGADGQVYSFRKDGTEESLGSQVMNGVMADGMRTSYTIPAGDFGNDRPITSVTESWYSPDLHLTVMYKRSDPREGEVTRQYTGIKRAEPDPSLFQLPAGYTLNQNQEKRRQDEIR
jgi:hypothetical protein